VTGGARGLGRATARLLAQRGAAVSVNYAVHAGAAQALVAEILTAGGRAIAVAADVADSAAVEAMVARTEAELGPVPICGEQVATRESRRATSLIAGGKAMIGRKARRRDCWISSGEAKELAESERLMTWRAEHSKQRPFSRPGPVLGFVRSCQRICPLRQARGCNASRGEQ
jgi:NAD(P)-dependent dehydrogenase (short-subunit alcohol dehydrogenase family)